MSDNNLVIDLSGADPEDGPHLFEITSAKLHTSKANGNKSVKVDLVLEHEDAQFDGSKFTTFLSLNKSPEKYRYTKKTWNCFLKAIMGSLGDETIDLNDHVDGVYEQFEGIVIGAVLETDDTGQQSIKYNSYFHRDEFVQLSEDELDAIGSGDLEY